MQRFTDLKLWQRSHALLLQVYRCTEAFGVEPRAKVAADHDADQRP